MNIALSTDNNYVKYLAVCLVTLFESNKSNELKVYVICNNVCEKNKEKLLCLAEKYNQTINFIEMEALISNLKTDGTFPLAAFSRLFLTNLIGIDRVLYIDCDSAVVNDLKELWEFDLGDNWIGGVWDLVVPFYKKSIGLKVTEGYINSGMLLMDLKKLRSVNWNEKVISFIKKYKGSVPHHDQGVVNGVASGHIAFLHPKFNVMDFYLYNSEKELKRLSHAAYVPSDKVIMELRMNPVFIHYTAGVYGRPWDIKCRHPMQKHFKDAVELAGYKKDEIYIDKPENKNALTMWKLRNILPFSVFAVIYDLIAFRKEYRKMRMVKSRKNV